MSKGEIVGFEEVSDELSFEQICCLLREHVATGGDLLNGGLAQLYYKQLCDALDVWRDVTDPYFGPYDAALKELVSCTTMLYRGERP